MDKILKTQMTNIFNNIENQEEEIEIAARLLSQAVMSEGNILLKTFHEFNDLEHLLINNEQSLPSITQLTQIKDVKTPDRVLVISKDFTKEVQNFTHILDKNFIEYVLITNSNKDNKDTLNNIHHFIDLSSKRKLVPTPNFERILNPYISALLFIYYHLYILIDEMTNDEYDE